MTSRDLSKIRAMIIDMDGVLWRGSQPIGDLAQVFGDLKRLSVGVILATNNSTRSAAQYLNRLAGYGAVLEAWQILNSSEAAAQYLQQEYPQGGPVFMIGEEGLSEALTRYGFTISDDKPLAVVVGMDRQLTYAKLVQATLLIRAGARFIGTNPDRTFPTPAGLTPGAGSILAAIEAATDVKPYIIGKPSPIMYEVALKRFDFPPESVLIIGDRLDTDIAGAQTLNCPTGLVLSGVTTLEQAESWLPRPDIIAEDLGEIVNQFKAANL